jgi:glycosyltransferase involved in cell wall biosynthesis
VLGAPPLAMNVRQKGRQRIAEFSWEACARQSRAIYAEVLRRR